MSIKNCRYVRANEAVSTAYLSMLLPCLPCTNIRAAIHILILPLPLELVPSKLPLVHGTIWHPHHALPTALALSVAASIATPLGYQVQTHPLTPVVAVLPKVGVTVGIDRLGALVMALVCGVKSSCKGSLTVKSAKG